MVLFAANNTIRVHIKISVGSFEKRYSTRVAETPSREVFMGICCLFRRSAIAFRLIYSANDVEINPGPDVSCPSLGNYTRARGLKIVYINVRSIMGKLDSLKLLIAEKPIDILRYSI